MLSTSFASHQRDRFLHWWRAPITKADRVLGAFVGALGSFCIALLASVVVVPSPIAGATLLLCAGAVAVACLVLGAFFPKATTAILFPFSIFGVSGVS